MNSPFKKWFENLDVTKTETKQSLLATMWQLEKYRTYTRTEYARIDKKIRAAYKDVFDQRNNEIDRRLKIVNEKLDVYRRMQ